MIMTEDETISVLKECVDYLARMYGFDKARENKGDDGFYLYRARNPKSYLDWIGIIRGSEDNEIHFELDIDEPRNPKKSKFVEITLVNDGLIRQARASESAEKEMRLVLTEIIEAFLSHGKPSVGKHTDQAENVAQKPDYGHTDGREHISTQMEAK